MVAARLRCVALQTAEAAKAVGMARPPVRPRIEQELAPPLASGAVDLHRDSRTGPPGQQHREVCCLADIFPVSLHSVRAKGFGLRTLSAPAMAGKLAAAILRSCRCKTASDTDLKRIAHFSRGRL